jgi:hypothetical protein
LRPYDVVLWCGSIPTTYSANKRAPRCGAFSTTASAGHKISFTKTQQSQKTIITNKVNTMLMKYKDNLVLTKEKIKEAMAPLRAKEMKKKAELEICKIDSEIAEKEQKIQEHASEYPIDFDKLINAIDDLDLVKRRKEQFEKIIAEMFED